MVLRCLTVALAALLTSSGLSAQEPQSFRELHALIKPQEAELKWDKIPWLTSLWEARQKAAAQGKPILLWEMDGHPLGCT
jgi:hypothetical protein